MIYLIIPDGELRRITVELRAKEKELSRDIKRKDRALAEMAARIILIKKSQLLFGVSEEDE